MGFLTKIFGTRNDKVIKKLKPILYRVNELEPSIKKLSQDELLASTGRFRERFEKGESLDSILPEAYAVCREAGFRVLGQRHHDVQILGGIVLHQGKISEMRTGEGKTLTATLPLYLHGITGKGAHLITVNDYLARRDAEWMGRIYGYLGLSTGIVVHDLSSSEKKASYSADITYGTNNEFGFDYLRDNMKTNPDRLVQRGFHFGIVDEVDSILIDEARTPLIISGATETDTVIYGQVNAVIPGIRRDVDYTVDEKTRVVALTEDGISKMEKRLGVKNLYDPDHIKWLHHLQQALKAHVIFKKDVDYVVRNGEVLIVDEFTGRLMPGRRYSDGLHGALEAKEHVPVQQESQTLATITLQNYFRLYDILAGMTGTADTEAVEFKKIYNLDVVVIPTHRQIIRKDEDDVVYRTMREKFHAIAKDIHEAGKRGQPVLVGTVSVEKSELLSHLLKQLGVPHEVLNAKNHAKEAQIIEKAGHRGHVTIATNMAGRGTDIVLDEGARAAGGLYVIGTERHESRRIDNQLRGRTGRQGDPGLTKFFLSLEDDLLRIFNGDRLSSLMARIGMEEGEAIVSPMVTRSIERAQKRVEEHNFSSRKNLLEYDDVMSQQRQVIYKRRSEALMSHADVSFMGDTILKIILNIGGDYSPEHLNQEKWNLIGLVGQLTRIFSIKIDIPRHLSESPTLDEIAEKIQETILTHYKNKMANLKPEHRLEIESHVYLQVIDAAWKEHLQGMDHLKDSVSLRGYAQRDPLQEYKKEAFQLFAAMVDRIQEEATMILLQMPALERITMDQSQDDEFEGEEIHLPVGQGSLEEPSLEKLIYHGSREPKAPQDEKSPQTLRREADKVGRNDICPCGSGKKFKKCHGAL
jgi:preprotein translocase subunit SecA